MKSLQEQLLNKGLIDKDKARKVVKDKRKQSKAERKAAGKKSVAPDTTPTALSDRNVVRDRELNRIKQQQAEQKAVAAQIRQLIKTNSVDRGEGEVAFNFVYQKVIRKLEMQPAIHQQLTLGRLNIVALVEHSNVRFELVPKAVANKIAERDPALVIKTESREADNVDTDDPYAEFVVPDDLMW